MKKISQREARRDKKRLKALEDFYETINRVYSQDVIGGIHLTTIEAAAIDSAIVRASRKLGHAVIVVGDNSSSLKLMAVGSLSKKY